MNRRRARLERKLGPRHRIVSLAATAGIVAVPRLAAADDGIYGRLRGDVALHVGAGAAASGDGLAMLGTGSAHYLQSAGLVVRGAQSTTDAATVTRWVVTAVEVRPLFLARFGLDLERGPERLDLTLDSLSLAIGAFWRQGGDGAGNDALHRPGLETTVGFDIPLVADAEGLFVELRGALRWRNEDLAADTASTWGERGAYLSLGLAWHEIFFAHVVDAGDRRSP